MKKRVLPITAVLGIAICAVLFFMLRYAEEKAVMQAYLDQKYPQQQTSVERITYNKKWQGHFGLATSGTEPKINFHVELYDNGSIIDDYLEQRLSSLAKEAMQPVLDAHLGPLDELRVQVFPQTGTEYPADLAFDPKASLPYNVYITWSQTMTKQEFAEKSTSLIRAMREGGFLGDDYFFSNVRYAMSVNAESGNLDFSAEKLLQGTHISEF